MNTTAIVIAGLRTTRPSPGGFFAAYIKELQRHKAVPSSHLQHPAAGAHVQEGETSWKPGESCQASSPPQAASKQGCKAQWPGLTHIWMPLLEKVTWQAGVPPRDILDNLEKL